MQTQSKRSHLVGSIIDELEKESVATRNLLAIVPDEELSWRPHPKAMSLGQLALHVATTQGGVAEATVNDTADSPDFVHAEANSREELLAAFEESLAKAISIVSDTSDERALETWKLVDGERLIVEMPRIEFWRTVMLNHVYHHRGQLSTYLRTLDIPLPSIYGPSADVNPFG